MLGEPALVAAHDRGDPQREAFLAEERVAAVARAVAPDLARLGKMHDVLVLAVARPAHVLLRRARAARRPSARTARTAPSLPSIENTACAHPRHEPHVDDDVRAVRDLDPDMGDGTADRPHRERHHVHRAPAHRSRRKGRRSVLRIAAGATQLLVGPRVVFAFAADERAVLDPRHIRRVGAREVASGPQRRIERAAACPRRPFPRRAGRIPPHSHRTRRCAAGFVSAAMLGNPCEQARMTDIRRRRDGRRQSGDANRDGSCGMCANK